MLFYKITSSFSISQALLYDNHWIKVMEMTETLEDFSASLKHFGAFDYAVFVLMLAVCSLIGLFFGYKDHIKHKANKTKSRRGSETLDYLLGGKNVQVFPGRNYKSSKLLNQRVIFSSIFSGDVTRCFVRFGNHTFGNQH
jgi:hypothetical protein